jgi:hypothetical protein
MPGWTHCDTTKGARQAVPFCLGVQSFRRSRHASWNGVNRGDLGARFRNAPGARAPTRYTLRGVSILSHRVGPDLLASFLARTGLDLDLGP